MTSGPRGSELTTLITSTATTKTSSVVLKTFDLLSDPCDYLLSQLSTRIRSEIGVPVYATLSCSLISLSLLSDARREYRWTVIASWTV